MKKAIKTIDINANEWFDRAAGNSYFSGTVTINYGMPSEISFKMPFQYGYGDSYKDAAFKLLKENGLLKEIDRIWEVRDKKIILRANKVENCKKRDLI